MIDLPEVVAMATRQTQDDTTGSAVGSVHDERQHSLNGAAAGEQAIFEETEALRRELSMLTPLNKSTSYVDSVFEGNSVCTPVPEPQTDDVSVSPMKKLSTIDAEEILPFLTATKSFCARYMGELAKKSSSRGPTTPMGSPQASLVSRQSSGRVTLSNSGRMTPPVGSFCPLAYGPLANSQSVEEADPTYSPVNLTTRLSKTPEDAMAKLVAPIATNEPNQVEKIDETSENAGTEEEAMETDETGKDDSFEGRETTPPPPPMLSPVRSLTDAGNTTGNVAAVMPVGLLPHPGGPAPVQIAFSFDTTGSMSQCIDEVRAQLRDIIQRLLGDVPHLQIAVIAHGDYCDASEFYMIKSVDFTNDVNALTQFVNDVSGTGGGDYEECYEYVLNYARNKLSWQPWTQRSLVMIGDAIPHAKDYHLNTMQLDWEHEANLLFLNGVHIYAVQCQKSSNEEATPFWEGLAVKTAGKHIAMEDFSTIVDLMLAICYKETGAEFFDVSILIVTILRTFDVQNNR